MSIKSYELKDICKIRSGKRLPKGTDFSESTTDYKYIRARDIKNGKINGQELVCISEEIHNKLSRYIVNTDDIVITIVGASVGDVAYVTNELEGVNLTENAVRLTDFNKCVNSKYLMYVLNSKKYWELMQRIAGGAAQPKLGIYKIQSIVVDLPERKKQDKVADILSAYDDIIENKQKQIRLLEEAAQRLYKEWFVDLRFPGHENTSIVDGIPQGWEEHAIAELCERINAGGTPSRRNKNFWDNPTIKWYKTQELQDCWLIDSDEKISVEGQSNSSAKFFPKNTILMAIYASPTLGRLGVLDSVATCNQAALCLKADESKISWQWLYEKLYELREHYNGIARGAGQQNISGEVVKQTIVLCPTKKIMDKYTQIVAPLFEKRRMLQKQNIRLTEARDHLLPKLMSGELEV